LQTEQQVSINRVCRLIELSRTTYHYQSKKDDIGLMEMLKKKAEEHPRE
jgi:hypothetical protein